MNRHVAGPDDEYLEDLARQVGKGGGLSDSIEVVVNRFNLCENT